MRILVALLFMASLSVAAFGAPMASTQQHIYYPGTESLAPDEMRITAVGTGAPQVRRSQVAACWLVELGNGQKFLFDVGAGSFGNLSPLDIPYDRLDKVFLSHLHVDHIGDLGALYVCGWVNGRSGPLQVWGPSGDSAAFGTAATVNHIKAAYTWDVTSRIDDIPGHPDLQVHEFDYRKPQVVYQNGGVVIRAFPAIHVIDGAVSYSLEWNGMKFVYGGDTIANKWYVEYGKGADVAVHECFFTVPQLIHNMHFPVKSAYNIGTQFHTPPQAAGRVFSLVKPRMAVPYHTFNEFDTHDETIADIRKFYDGPLTLADDYLVFNVTKAAIRVRRLATANEVWVPPPSVPGKRPTAKLRPPLSEELRKGRLNVDDVLKSIVDGLSPEERKELQK